MRKFGLAIISFLLFGASVFAPNSWAQRAPIIEQIAKAYGVDSWDKVEAIRYTWHEQFAGLKISRSWEWEPKTSKVSYEGKDKDGKPANVTSMRSELDSQPEIVKKEIECFARSTSRI